MKTLKKISLGIYPTPLYRLEQISRKYGKNIYIKRDDLCGIALGGNKVRKLEYLLAQAKEEGCDVVFTTGGAQSNHAMLTAACGARLGMKVILILKKRGVTDYRGNLVLDDFYGADVRFMDTDDYADIYEEMHRIGEELETEGHRCFYIRSGGSSALGAVGYTDCVKEIAMQAKDLGFVPDHIVSATGSGGTTAGLLLGAKMYMPETDILGIAVDTDDFSAFCPQLAEEAAELLETDLPRREKDLEICSHVGAGYAIPNREDLPFMKELAEKEGILLDPVYTGKAYAGMMHCLEEGRFGDAQNIIFVHTGGAAALFAMDLRNI